MSTGSEQQYESKDGTILERDAKGRVRNPVSNRYMVTTGKAFRALLKSGDVVPHTANSIVSIEFAKPDARGKRKEHVYVRIQVRMNREDLARLQRMKMFDPTTPFVQRLIEDHTALFRNIASAGPLPILRITSRSDLKQGIVDEQKRFAENVESQPHLCSDFVKGGIPIMSGKLAKEYKPDACALNLLLEACGDRIPKKFRTVDALAKAANIPKKYQYKANLNEMKTLSEMFGIKMTFVKSSGQRLRQYTPPTYSTRPHSHFRAILNGHHMWLATENIHRFDQVYGTRYIEDTGNDLKELKIKWSPSEQIKFNHYVSTAEDVIDVAGVVEENDNAVCSENIELIAAELWNNHNVRVGDICVNNGVMTSFKVKIGDSEKFCVKYVHEEENQPGGTEVDEVAQANKVAEYMKTAEGVIMQAGCASTFNESFRFLCRDFPKPPMCGRLVEEIPELCAQFDQSKAYSTVMRNIKQLPIFSEAVSMYLVNSQDVEPCCFYYVRVSETDLFCAPTEETFMYVDTVEFLRAEGVSVELIAVQRPIKINRCNMPEFVSELYGDDKLTELNKKAVMNVTYGRTGRDELNITKGQLYETCAEAAAEANKVYELINGLYCGYTERHITFKDGFQHMARIVL